MAGIYVHIPFCRQACNYCNFHFTTSRNGKNDFIAALLKEVGFQRDYLAGKAVETIYFGGGTPSMLDAADLSSILTAIRQTYAIIPHPEITLEANPDDIANDKIIDWKSAGINRLSLGVQSFYNDDLKWMNRAHSAEQALTAIHLIQNHGIDNLTIDLIYGLPGMSDEHWKANIQRAVALNIPHLSCYALTVEAKTILSRKIAEKKATPVNSDDQARQFLILMDALGEAGYDHYEVSNFAKPGMQSRHNSAYWQGRHYLGLGPSAHSFDGTSRQWNVSDNKKYASAIQDEILLFEKEVLTPVQRLNEYIMTSIRTMEGCSLNFVADTFGPGASEELEVHSRIYTGRGVMQNLAGNLVLTKDGKLLADGIAANLFFESINDFAGDAG